MKNRVIDTLKSYILQEKNRLFILLAISMIASVIAVIQPLLMQKFIDEALLVKDIDNFYFFVFLITIISVFSIALSIFLQYNYTKLSIKILYSLRLDIFEKIFVNKKLFFQRHQVGDLLSRLQGDISELQRFGVDSIFALFSAVFGLIGALVIMFYFDTALAIFALILFPIEFFLLKPMYKKMHSSTKEVRQSSALVGSFMIESLRYINFLKKFNNTQKRKNSLDILQTTNKKNILHQQIIQIQFTQIPVVISLIARISLILFGGTKVINGEISIGELIAFLSYFSLVLSPVHTVLGIMNNIPKLKVSIERLNEIVPQKIEDKEIDILPSLFDIELNSLSFSYPNSKELFKNITLKIPASQKVVLLGENGVGKSTLVDLLLNNLESQTGDILLAGKNIKNINNDALQTSIGLVEQNPVILSTTLKENLLIAKKSASTSKLLNTLESVGLLSWYETLELGLETKLSEDGQNLSGGQKQRLAIARLILQKPSVVIMDEPTSSVDKNFIEIIDSLIDENFKESTKIIISHHNYYKNARFIRIRNQNIEEDTDV